MIGPGNRATLLTFVAISLVFLVPFAMVVWPYLLAFLTGVVLSVLSRPLYAWLCARGLRPALSSLVVTLLLVVCVLGPMTAFVWSAVQQAIGVANQLVDRGGILAWLDRVASWWPIRPLVEDPAAMRNNVNTVLTMAAREVGNLAFSLLGQVPAMLFQGAICTLTVYFLLIDGGRFWDWITGKLPLPTQVRMSLDASFQHATRAVVFSSMASTGAQAVLILVAFLALGVPDAFLWAFTAFILAWIPTLGTMPITLGGALWLYTQGGWVPAGIMIGVAVAVGLIDNVIRSWMLHGSEAMHPLVSLVSILGGIALFGLVGAFVGPLLAAMVTAVLDTWTSVARHCDIPIAENGELLEVPLPEPPPESAPDVRVH